MGDKLKQMPSYKNVRTQLPENSDLGKVYLTILYLVLFFLLRPK